MPEREIRGDGDDAMYVVCARLQFESQDQMLSNGGFGRDDGWREGVEALEWVRGRIGGEVVDEAVV